MAIDFSLSPRQNALRGRARQFAEAKLSALSRSVRHLPTAQDRFLATRPVYEEMIAAGFLRELIPTAFGGDGEGLLDAAMLTEELYAGDASVTLTLLGSVLGILPVVLAGNDEQRSRLLAPFLTASGAPLAAFCLTEPGGSSNWSEPRPAEGVRTIARRSDNGWRITGAKKWVSSATGWDGAGADLLCILCRGADASSDDLGVGILAAEPRRSEGAIVLDRVIESVGHRAHLQPEFRISDLMVPESNVLAPMGHALPVTEAAFIATAALVGVFGVALMRATWEFTLRFAQTEKRGGPQPIIEHQAVGYALADAKGAIEAVRGLCWRACYALDHQQPCAAELAIHAKIIGSETAVRVITDLMRVVGVDSYDSELPLAGWLQDALALPVFDGGNVGVRRKQLHAMLQAPDYDPRATLT
jgi:butyryl-CoA dehydrogenase